MHFIDGSRSNAKLILGAFLGRPLLQRRRCYDVYKR